MCNIKKHKMNRGYGAKQKQKKECYSHLLVHKVLTNGSVEARARGALIDVFLTVKARKSHITFTARKEKSLKLIFCLRWKIEDLSVSCWHMQRAKKKKSLEVQ